MTPKGDRIQLTFSYQGKRRRPTLNLAPTQTNLKHAARRLSDIKQRIRNGTFDFAEEFPDYRFLSEITQEASKHLFGTVADQFMASVGDLEFATRASYKRIINSFWRPRFGEREINAITYAELSALIGGHPWGSRKTRNNVLSVGKRVFGFAYDAEIISRNPLERVRTLKQQKPAPDPYTIAEAEQILGAIRKDWGDEEADYQEAQFFTGTRPSEQIALEWPQIDLQRGVVRVDRAIVMGRPKGVKTGEVRDIELYPRALAVYKRQFARTGLAGGRVWRYHDLQVQLKHWAFTHKKLKVRYRPAKNTRQSSVSWNLMMGKNLLWVAEQHGHSAAVMLKVYAKWTKGATEKDVQAIRAAFENATSIATRKSPAL